MVSMGHGPHVYQDLIDCPECKGTGFECRPAMLSDDDITALAYRTVRAYKTMENMVPFGTELTAYTRDIVRAVLTNRGGR
jgi:hypothetical protein